MKKKKLIKEVEKLKEANTALIKEIKDYKNLQLTKKIDKIVNDIKEIDPNANLTQNLKKDGFGWETECTLTFNIRGY